ncbi:helix-turn-helix domain-containing protein [Tamlana crocina]|uniref:Helix-turn-helix domain-containing protein n=1 Tax=Tamlana crocina TaxID=393006 RepID=A0ABX1DAW3_9FLAO|nr:helix-turn-helix transcriptional regulator [Tamlana crocina]NJX14264.1 helix-turn-helix domain-containing protein [Tamlana crocina]
MSDQILTYNKITSVSDIKIEPFDVAKRYTKPHKHNKYLELVFFTKGSGFHYLDAQPYEIKPPIAFLIHNDQVHHWSIDSVPEGFVIIIKESFLERITDNAVRFQLSLLKDLELINIDEKDQALPLLFEALCLEMKRAQVNQEFLESALKAVLSKLIGYSKHKISINKTSVEHMFLELLSQNLKNNVTFYAKQLHTTSQNLNAVCQKSFQKSASDVIAEFIIKEVKRQLLYTTKNISDIAFDLGFKDTSNFTKFFKRHTGMTPLNFKKNE